MKTYKLGPSILMVFLFAALCHGDDLKALTLATGADRTPYHNFGLFLAERLSNEKDVTFKINVRPSSGSIENLKLIASKVSDLAVVQNDIAHYVYYGKNSFPVDQSFKAIYPLYLEHVWIISKNDPNIKVLNDFKDKVISIGAKNSGSRQNALDILREAGLKEGIDFVGKSLNYRNSVLGLIKGTIDVIFLTHKSIPEEFQETSGEYKIHQIPEELIDEIIKKKPYYTKSLLDLSVEHANFKTLSVRAYLVGRDKLTKYEVEKIIKLLIQSSSDLIKHGFEMGALNETIRNEPIPLNKYAKEIFGELGYIKIKKEGYFNFIAIVLVVIFVLYSSNTVKSYDRSGRPIAANSFFQKAVYFAAKGEAFIYTILIFISLILLDVIIIQYFEGEFVKDENTHSIFSQLTILKGAITLFLYMASGYATQTFPVSSMGQIFAAVLPLIGVATIGAIFLIFLEKSRKQSEKNERGLAKLALKNHVLICGWNEIGPDLIYNLTSSESPERKRVVIVANLDIERPVQYFGFDNKYVYYCKGDSTKPDILAKASAEHAHSVVVLASNDHINSWNTQGLMTVLVVRDYIQRELSMKREVFIASELRIQDSRKYFEASGANVVVNSGLIKNRLLGLVCISPSCINFLISALTYDEESEIYSIQVSELPNCIGKSPYELMSQWGKNNVNLLGMGFTKKTIGETQGRGNLDIEFDPLITKESLGRKITEGNTIFYSANNPEDVFEVSVNLKSLGKKTSQTSNSLPNIIETKKNILLVGSYKRCIEIRDFLQSFPLSIEKIFILTEDLIDGDQNNFVICGKFSDDSAWKSACVHDVDCILILFADEANSESSCGKTSENLNDSMAIIVGSFVSKLINEVYKNRNIRPVIFSEIYDENNSNIFLNSGIDFLIPTQKIIALMLSKTIYSKGTVCNLITSLLDKDSKFCFREISVTEEDYFFGKTINEVISNPVEGFRVYGWVPISDKKEKNKGPDYSMVLVPSDSHGEVVVKDGDIIFGLANVR